MSSNPNRNKVLLGFSAVVAVLVVAFLMWPANVRKEDASGAIGAVQKHHAPQITKADVILGGESVKQEQKLLSTDFLADAAKLRSISASRDTAAAREFASELQMRYMRAAREAVEAASRVQDSKIQASVAELNSMLANKATLSDQEMQLFAQKLADADMEANSEKIKARLDSVEQELAHMSLADEQLAASRLSDIDATFNRIDADINLADEAQYLAMMEMESRTLARAQANELELAARQLEARASQNIAQAADREEQMAMRCGRILGELQAAESRGTAQARMTGSHDLSARLGALAQRLNQRQAAAREVASLRQLDARSSQ